MDFLWRGCYQPASSRARRARVAPSSQCIDPATTLLLSSALLLTGPLTSRVVCANNMAKPHFNSQHSEVMLDVSAFHSSSPSAPHPKHNPEAKFAQSPTVEASQSEARVSESVDRVEDSYHESLPMQPPPQRAEDDEEDDLYSLSPKGRQSLDATVAKRKAQAQCVS